MFSHCVGIWGWALPMERVITSPGIRDTPISSSRDEVSVKWWGKETGFYQK